MLSSKPKPGETYSVVDVEGMDVTVEVLYVDDVTVLVELITITRKTYKTNQFMQCFKKVN